MTCNPPKVWRNLIPGTTERDYGLGLIILGPHSFLIESEVNIVRRFWVIEYEELMNRNAELHGKNFQILERRSIDSSFDQAKEVYGDTEQFRELRLAHVSVRTYRLEAIAEFFAEARQMNFYPSVDSRLQALFVPPNEITGSFWGNGPKARTFAIRLSEGREGADQVGENESAAGTRDVIR